MVPDIKNTNDKKYAEYLNTFGILKVKNFLNTFQVDEINALINKVFEMAWQMKWEDIYNSRRSGAVEPLAKYINNYIEFGAELGILLLAEKLVGKSCIYLGSDASMFWRGSVLHSDAQVVLPLIKFAIYLQDSDIHGNGEFFYVPGTHHSGSIYTDLAYRYCRWPEGGGLTENYNIGIEEGGDIVPPMVNVPISAGDLIIFDSRMLHGTRQINSILHHRKMITWVFSAHPDDFSDNYYKRLGIEKEKAINELNKLNEITICKNGPQFKEEIFNSESVIPYKNMFIPSYELSKKIGNVRSNSINAENIKFFTQNRVKIK